jgi:hypothetical protein
MSVALDKAQEPSPRKDQKVVYFILQQMVCARSEVLHTPQGP